MPRLHAAIDGWTQLNAPWETARSRLALAEALAATGQTDRAELELRAARTTLADLGAALELRRADELATTIGIDTGGTGAAHAADRELRAFAFTDIVDSTRLAETLGDEAWQSILRRHDDMVRRVVAEHGGEVVKHTGDGFFLAFGSPDAAIEALIEVQRRLADYRRREGFAPTVRSGAHLAEATRSGTDYLGSGVTLAARIGGAANGSEILVSRTMIDGARRPHPQLDARKLELKGIAGKIEAVSIRW